MKRIFLYYSVIALSLLLGCKSSKGHTRQGKLNCYAEKLSQLEKTSIYREVMKDFLDTFKVMKNDRRYFGVPEVVTNEVDSAIFFNKANSECLLIVLQKNTAGLVFGNARIVTGQLHGSSWLFRPSVDYSFDKSYFDLYPDNNFENLSKTARYSVLKDGDVKSEGCEIDENYWFKELKK